MAIVRDNPSIIFVVGPPRSGTTLLYELLSNNFEVASQIKESHDIWEGPFHPKHWDYTSNKVPFDIDITDDSLTSIVNRLQRRSFVRCASRFYDLYNRYGSNRYLRKIILVLMKLDAYFGSVESQVLVEKTPRNCLRLQSLNKGFPNARFLFVVDDLDSNIAKVEKAWKSKTPFLESVFFGERFARASYQGAGVELLKKWKFVLPVGWENANGNVGLIAKMQVEQCLSEITRFYESNRQKCMLVQLNDLIANPDEFASSIVSNFKLKQVNPSIQLSNVNRLK